MLIKKDQAEQLVKDARWLNDEFLLPNYSSSISNIPGTLEEILLGRKHERALGSEHFGKTDEKGVEKVILVLVDGCGLAQWNKYNGSIKSLLAEKGNVSAITSVFPSTTAAALTSLSTGLTPIEHGLIEWYIYLDEVEEIIASLPFTPIGARGRDTLLDRVRPRVLFDGKSFFLKLRKEGIACYSFLNKQIAKSAYTRLSQNGSNIVSYSSSSDMFVLLRKYMKETGKNSFFYVYWSMVDSIEHNYGPSFEPSILEIELFFYSLYNSFLSRITRDEARNTMLIITADHGQIDIQPEKTIYLNSFRKLVKSFKNTRSGRKILPSGSARDVFLHVNDSDGMKEYLSKKLENHALVMKTDDAVNLGLFGRGSKSKKFSSRAGDIIILPYSNKTVWYRFEGLDKLDLRGHHGSLTTDELIVPFYTCKLDSFC